VVSSDAEFVCLIYELESRKLESHQPDTILILCNGSYATVDGGPELRCRRRVSWGEVVVQGGSRTVFSSDPEAMQNEELASGQLS
jgi:hypothetical protein